MQDAKAAIGHGGSGKKYIIQINGESEKTLCSRAHLAYPDNTSNKAELR